jgi:hypothetical protein
MTLEDASPEWIDKVRDGYHQGGLKGLWRKWLEFQQGRIKRGQGDPSYIALVHAYLWISSRL